MAVYNYAGGEINIKIVYYGPGLCGKTTNLEHMYSKLPRENKGKMVSMKTRTDRTLFFDFLPIEVGELNGMKVRFLLYTVPGQVYYNATRKLVLKGVDALVFVADSSDGRMGENRESLENLEENLNELGLTLAEIPWVMQYNKRDLEGCTEREVMDRELNTWNVPAFEAVAVEGGGVYETFEGIAKRVFTTLRDDFKDVTRQDSNSEEETSERQINVEVVAQGRQRNNDSEADESESLGYAEEREEEHESVSEFVDNVLCEGEVEETINMGATRGGYEEYGHVVELGGESGEEKTEARDSAVALAKEPSEEMDIIKDPLDKLADPSGDSEIVSSELDCCEEETLFEKKVQVPIELTEEEIRNHVPIKVVLDIKVTSS